MVNVTPSPIKEYYIAYFDILGYKEFFCKQPEKVPEFLNTIHDAIRRTNEHVGLVNHSPVISKIGNIDIEIKIFSDNILLCMEALNEPIEQVRLISFLQIVSDIQRGFIIDYGLFVRGGICKGKLSINDDYIFGQGLIDVVSMEDSAQFPRIIIDPKLITFLRQNLFFTQEEYDRALTIDKATKKGTKVLSEDKVFYSRILFFSQLLTSLNRGANQLTLQWPDEQWVLSYLGSVQASELLGKELVESLLQTLKNVSSSDYQLASQPTQDIDILLKTHKERVETELKKYGKNADIAVGDTEAAKVREHILKKYIWVMAYHNQMCVSYQKMSHFISTSCNCDKRFMKMTVEVFDDGTGK